MGANAPGKPRRYAIHREVTSASQCTVAPAVELIVFPSDRTRGLTYRARKSDGINLP